MQFNVCRDIMGQQYRLFLMTVLIYPRGPFITALGRTWCPGHFMCSQATCGKSLQESGFVEEQGKQGPVVYQGTP